MENNLLSMQERLEQIVHKYDGFHTENIEFEILFNLSEELIDTFTLNEKLSEIDYNEVKKMLVNMFLLGKLSVERTLNNKS